ncbi:MAG TPA: hypothetical protein PLA68_01505 [Panacibacter sp.]|nr:hypothetical protein [Panacibacter sp.]
MRTIILIAVILFVTAVKAQSILPLNFLDYTNMHAFANNIHSNNSIAKKKWTFSSYSGMSAGFASFKGGNATIVNVPIGLQLNRRLTNNLYAFANVSVAPAYVNFNRSFITADINKINQNNGFARGNSFGMYSSASLGLMYINNEKTFSISGSISVERSSYPLLPYYPSNYTRPNAVISPNR